MAEKFVAIDFETANASLASICQVGAVTFEDGRVVDSWGSLINPQDHFDWVNVDIHGIDATTVKDAPTFQQIYPAMLDRLRDQVVVSHTSFDRTALFQAIAKHNLTGVSCRWLDSARVVRRAWAQWSRSGYGLSNVCGALGIRFTAHDAVEDARAAGEVLLQAISTSGIGLDAWMTLVQKPINVNARKPIGPTFSNQIAMKGNPDGALAGEEIVFTGTLTLARCEAAVLAAQAGCQVATGIRRTTTLLVVGDLDIRQLAGHQKSIKQRKAEELIAKGHPIRILTESDFLRIVDLVH
ncbi:Exonuclease-like protein [Paraburkholderia ribeironis]|uniref:Exonuclease-like protein n=1 Tax=Paraburkholderia ribeironis TaxID=1247936 RepID=A0A1N7SJN2_9BURK|nr:exonuclease domain-containing protein [Paraburkholderia ribeironis]SIT47641.1 Exonuclease-like protein [Paraburkholderia ribeironis]